MKFISWNVNGLRACVQKGFLDFFNEMNADFFCLQETKLQPDQIQLELPGYEQYWCSAEKKGYSGTAIFTKHTPQSARYGIGVEELDTEGRVITLEYPEFYLVTCYTPNAQRGLARLEHRMKWEDAFREYLMALDSKKAVILCGDLNVAHNPIDLKNPGSNRGNAGFSDEERAAFGRLLDSGFTDTFRYLHPDAEGCYTWWSYMFNARQNNAGWRIDYFVVSDRLKDQIYRTPIHSDILGSDHCPVELDLSVSCNGGIWQSESEGQASEILPEHKASNAKKYAIRAGIAAGLLAVGFTGGYFTNYLISGKDTQTPTDLPLQTLTLDSSSNDMPLQYVSASDAVKMTTDELIVYVIQIPELQIYASPYLGTHMTEEQYNKCKNTYPALAELEKREDAAINMRMRLFSTSTITAKTNVLSLLLSLDAYSLPIYYGGLLINS